jgi:putative sigma-54 modulation protein
MKYIFVGKNMEVGGRLKDRLVKKLGKLEKFFNPETEANVTMSIQKNWHILELTIAQNGITFRAEEKSDDMYVSIDKVVDIIERQIRKNKTRLSRRIHENAFKSIEDFDDSRYIVEEQDYRVLRTKKFPVKPMTPDEAILQMNLLSHEFFVFVNSDTKQTNVVYKRKDDSYGLIEPEQ